MTNQNEGSSESKTGDYFELILQNLDTDHGGSSGSRSSPPILPRKSPKCTLGIRTTGKPRALPPPASSAIENDSILSNCDHSNQTATPPPLPAKTYDKRSSLRSCRLVDKAVQCSSKEEIVQDVDRKASRSISTEDGGERRVVRADGLLMVSTSANIILTQSNSVRTIVLTPNEPISTVSTPRMIVLQSKATPIQEEESSEERTRNDDTILRSPGTSSRLVLESLAPSLSRSQSRGCANEYVGDPVACKKPLFKKHNKKYEWGPSQGDESIRKGRGLVCQKCWKCKCNQCKINRGSKKDASLKAPRRDSRACSEKEEGRKESTKELLVSLRDDGKIVTRGLSEERTEEAESSTPGRRSAFFLRCFSVICCCSWKWRHDCCTWARPSDGCRCAVEEDEGETTEGDDDVFLTSNS